jgi:inner membrane protein
MTAMLQNLDHGALASLAALVGLAGRAAWPLFSSRVGVLRVQLFIGLAFAAHYSLIGIATAAIVNVVGSLQVAIVLLPLGARRARHISCGLIAAMTGASVVTWEGPASLFAAVGQMLMVVARMQIDVRAIFELLFIGQLLWCVHDIVVGSPMAIAADAVGLLVGAWMLARKAWRVSNVE